jgi:hypothetical protein
LTTFLDRKKKEKERLVKLKQVQEGIDPIVDGTETVPKIDGIASFSQSVDHSDDQINSAAVGAKDQQPSNISESESRESADEQYIWNNCDPEQRWNARYLNKSETYLEAFIIQRGKLLALENDSLLI